MTDDFNEAYRMAQVLCESDHGPGSWEMAHRKRAWYVRRALAAQEKRRQEIRADGIGIWGVLRRRFGAAHGWLKAMAR